MTIVMKDRKWINMLNKPVSQLSSLPWYLDQLPAVDKSPVSPLPVQASFCTRNVCYHTHDGPGHTCPIFQ